MQLDEMPRDCEPEPQPALFSRDRSFSLTKTIENVWQEIRRDAVASIADSQTRSRLDTSKIDTHAAATLCEFDRVRQQIPDHLSQTIRIALHQTLFRHEMRLQLDAFHVGSRAQCVERSVDDRREIEWMQIEPQVAGDDARDVQQIVDKSSLRAGVALDRLDRARGVGTFNFATPDHRRPTEY